LFARGALNVFQTSTAGTFATIGVNVIVDPFFR